MKKNKIIFVCIILFSFLCFCVYQYKKSKSYDVLYVKSPFEIVVDLNKNGIEDENEVIRLLDGYDYIHRDNLSPRYNIAELDLIALSYFTEQFVNDCLKDKTVTLKDGCLFVGTMNFNEKLLSSGYVFKDYRPVNEAALKKTLAYIHKTPLVLYNAKSNKYHKLNCKYGLMAHNYVCVPKTQLPKGAKGCKFCYPEKISVPTVNTSVKPVPLSVINGDLKILVTDYTTKMKPDRKGNTEICDELVKQMNNAKSSIDIAIYGYDKVPRIETAIKNAIARGVKVRLVYDIDARNSNIYADTMYFVNLIKNATNDRAIFTSECANVYTNYIMHDKFYIFDDSVVITGSANLSYTDMSGFNSNNVVVLNSKEIARIYKQEFEQMYNAKFHYLKQPVPDKENLVISNSVVSVYFSPTDSIIEKVIVPRIDNAKKNICIPAFLITDKRFAQSLINAKNRGVDIKIILDATNAKSQYSKHRLLRQHGILVKTETFAGKLHSKTIIIDNQCSIIGSMNFSKSGEKRNDENVLVINNSKLAIFNRIFFEYLWRKIDNYWLTHDANSEGLDSPGSCSDGIDNDYDGKIDMEDEGCHIYRGRYVR